MARTSEASPLVERVVCVWVFEGPWLARANRVRF